MTSTGATFTNVSGQSTYGWGAAAGTLYAISNVISIRTAVGDRIFLSSDHSESIAAPSYQFGAAGFGLIQIISVNRAGSVPPTAADVQSGAALIASSGNFTLDNLTQTYWQGETFTLGGSVSVSFNFNSATGLKSAYLKNCAIVITNTNAGTRITTGGSPAKPILDNTTIQFGNTGQFIQGIANGFDMTWINTPSAIQGATLPVSLISAAASSIVLLAARGVDLSTLTGTLLTPFQNASFKVLLDSCRINSGLTRYGTPGTVPCNDEVELVNCYDGTNTLNERHTAAGDATTDRSTYLSGGAQDDTGNYSLKLASSSRADKLTFPLDSFWFDVENAAVGSSKTATVEVISPTSLNNDDVSLLLEYMGTAASSIASFASSLPATVLTAGSALASSTAVWGNLPEMWSPTDQTSVVLSNGGLTALSTANNGGARGVTSVASGKYYFEFTYGTINTNSFSTGVSNSGGSLTSPTAGIAYVARSSGAIIINNVSSGSALGIISAGNVVGIALDLTNSNIWFRIAPSGNWNGSGTANPATNTGGLSISGLTGGLTLFPYFCGGVGDQVTANFGGSAFTGSVPSGFTSVLPTFAGTKQKLQVSFTPQVAGRVRGLVRLGKASTTVWANPQIAIS